MGGAHGCAAGSRRAKLLPVRQAHGERRSCLSGMLMMEEDAPCQYGLSLMRQVHVGRSIVDDAGAASRCWRDCLLWQRTCMAEQYRDLV